MCRKVPRIIFARLLGFLQSCCLAIKESRQHLSILYKDLNSPLDGKQLSWGSKCMIKISHRSLKELEHFWLRLPKNLVGRSWYPLSETVVLDCIITSDASQFAWGGSV